MKKIFTLLTLVASQTLFAQLTNLITFDGTGNGKSPYGNVIKEGAFLYGMTSEGGASNLGVIFKVKPDGTGYSKLLDFNGTANGSTPKGSLVSDGTNLYGMTSAGGANSIGTIFKISLTGTGYVKLLDFSATTNGSTPTGSLLLDGSTLYGVASLGGTESLGTIFSINKTGTGFTKLLDFDGTISGSSPLYSLHKMGGFLFGTTQYGGTNGNGTLFKIMPNGTGYMTLHSFNGTDGNAPDGGVTSDGTYLYGTTTAGGINTHGVLFKIKPDGTGYAKLHDFSDATSGSVPRGNPILVAGDLYGLTEGGGSSGTGVMYTFDLTSSVMTKLIDFTGFANGSRPSGALIYDGIAFYGTTRQGGSLYDGTCFKFLTGSSGIEELTDASVTVYPNPSNDIFTISTDNSVQFNEMMITTLEGKIIHSISNVSSVETINATEWTSGIYFIQLSNNTISKTIRFEKL